MVECKRVKFRKPCVIPTKMGPHWTTRCSDSTLPSTRRHGKGWHSVHTRGTRYTPGRGAAQGTWFVGLWSMSVLEQPACPKFFPAKGAVGRAGCLERCCHPAPQKAQLERAGVQIKRGFRDQLGRDILLLRSQEARLR